MTLLKLILYFIVLIAILMLAYYTTRFVGNGMGRKQDSGSIRVLERIAVARDSFLLVVEIQGTVMVLGVTPERIDKICDLEAYEPGRKAPGGQATAGGKLSGGTAFSAIFAGKREAGREKEE